MTGAQTRIGSLVEAAFNVLVGFIVAMGTNAAVLPLFGFHVNFTQDLGMTVIFTAVSVIRSYALRRTFNRLHTGRQA